MFLYKFLKCCLVGVKKYNKAKITSSIFFSLRHFPFHGKIVIGSNSCGEELHKAGGIFYQQYVQHRQYAGRIQIQTFQEKPRYIIFHVSLGTIKDRAPVYQKQTVPLGRKKRPSAVFEISPSPAASVAHKHLVNPSNLG